MEVESLVYVVAAGVATVAAMAVLIVAVWLTPRADRGGESPYLATAWPRSPDPAGRRTWERQ